MWSQSQSYRFCALTTLPPSPPPLQCANYSLELLPPMIQVLYLGHLGDKIYLDAGALATMFTNVAGLSVGLGLGVCVCVCARACVPAEVGGEFLIEGALLVTHGQA